MALSAVLVHLLISLSKDKDLSSEHMPHLPQLPADRVWYKFASSDPLTLFQHCALLASSVLYARIRRSGHDRAL